MHRDTSWLRAHWGVFIHYLADMASSSVATDLDPDTWNRRVESFDVERVAARIAATGAGWASITIGQNSGFFCSPNPVYDNLVQRDVSRLSRRDLVGDLATALAAHGVRTMAYLPSHAPAFDLHAVHRLRCTPPWNCGMWSLNPELLEPAARAACDERVTIFQRHWESIVAAWSNAWGDRVSAWWFDGCYHADRMYRHPEAPNFASFAAAARAGNPYSLVAMNEGVILPCRPQAGSDEDYTAGELDFHLPVPVKGVWGHWAAPSSDALVDGKQRHYLSFLGPWWGQGPQPRLPDAMAAAYTAMVTGSQAAISWDIPVAHDGNVDDAFLRQLEAIGNACRFANQGLGGQAP